jgi:hypothetical protein
MFDFSLLPFNFSLLLKYIVKRGIKLEYLPTTDVVIATKGLHIEYFVNYQTKLTPLNYFTILNDKFYSKCLMNFHGISVPKAKVFGNHQKIEAYKFAEEIGYPIVLKPTNSSQGNFVYANLKNENELSQVFEEFSLYSNQINMMIEQYFLGTDYRFLVIEGVSEPFIVHRTVPEVVGDGVLTILELIEKENYRRTNPRETCLCTIKVEDEESSRVLKHQNLTFDTIIPKGQSVKLRYNANVSWGAQCETINNEDVHPSYLNLAKQVHSLFPGNGFTSIDFLIKDINKPCSPDNYTFCEFNVDPGFSLHHMPGHGNSQNVLDPIVDLLFPETK